MDNVDLDFSDFLRTTAFLLHQPRTHPLSADNDADDGSKDAGGKEEEGDQKWSWMSFKFLVSLVGLAVFNGTVVLGNSLVILAVFTHSKLRPTTTNKFIVSLAVADLLVGIAVLPFSSANQMLRFWPFGRVWCRMWLAVDVWLCTASILNLCAISVDRYLAISRPFRYPQLMSPSRAKLLIISVWILSFIICFPPLIGWEDPTAAVANDNASPSPSSSSSLFHAEGGNSPDEVVEVKGIWHGSSELFDSSDEYRFSAPAPHLVNLDSSSHLDSFTSPQNSSSVGRSSNGGRMQCTLTSVPGYIIYSSCGSFWVPMLLMLIFYWKIYKTATSATAAFRRGFIEKKSVLSKTNSSSQAQTSGSLTLRVHRGSRITMRHSNGCISELLPPVTAVSLQLTRRSFDSQLAARNIGPVSSVAVPGRDPRASIAVPLNVGEAKALPPKIVVTASPSAGEEAKQGKEGEENRGRSERKSSIFSVDDEIKPKDAEKNSGKGDRKPSMMATQEVRNERAEKSGRNERRSSIFSMDEEIKWKERQEGRGRKPSMLPTHEEGKEKEDKSESDQRKSSIFSMDEERKWKEREERRGRKPSILSTAEEKQLKRAESRKDRKPSILSTEGVKGYGSVDTSRKNSFLEETDEKRSSLISVRLSKLNFIAQLRSLNREKKAAKTVGIIVGCFIVCWAPFFTVYLLGAFCRACTPPMLFHVFFWLGYCNSAINPFVYGLCSKEFRYAFQKLLRCRCEQRRDDGTLSHNQSTSVKSVSRLQSVLQSFKLQIATRSTSTTNTSPALGDDDRPVAIV